MSDLKDIYFKRLNPSHEKESFELIAKYLVRGNSYLKLIKRLNHEDIDQLYHDRIKVMLKQPYSFGAFEKSSDKLVSVLFAYVKKITSTAKDKKSRNQNLSYSVRVLTNFRTFLDSGLQKELNVDKVLEISLGVTHPNYKNYGLSNTLAKLLHIFSTETKCEYLVSYLTTEYICRIYEKNLPESIFKQVKFVDYTDYETGFNPFSKPEFPFLRMMLICQSLKAIDHSQFEGLKSLL